MGRLFSDSSFEEKLKRKYDIMAMRNQDKTDALDPDTAKFLSDEAYWKDMRARNTALELQKGENKNKVDLANIGNSGKLAAQESENTGMMARAKLIGDAEKYKADQSLSGVKYHSDMLRDSAKNSGLSETLKAHTEIIKDLSATPEQKAESIRAINSLTGNARSTEGFDVSSPAVSSSSTVTAAPATNPIRAGLDKAGAASMTFDTSMGTSTDNPLKKRKALLDSFYNMNPGIKRTIE